MTMEKDATWSHMLVHILCDDEVKEHGVWVDADGVEYVVYRHTFTPPGMTMEEVGRLLRVDLEEWTSDDNENAH